MYFVNYFLDWYFNAIDNLGYSHLVLNLFLAGYLSWVTAYVFIIKGIYKNKINEMPLLVGPANLVWEFIWGYIFTPELGDVFILGIKVWFILDLIINVTMLKYGYKQFPLDSLRKNFRWTYLVSLVSWFFIVYSFGKVNDDNPLGITSALMINVVMSGLYIHQMLFNLNLRGKGFSFVVAVLKCIGTSIIVLAAFFQWPDAYFLLTLGIISFALDIAYIILFKNIQTNSDQEQLWENQEESLYSVEA
ncbi:hypothetical protein [Flammeovirga sp. SubArs3]|uniref:transmembrane-type terpene cyclase n=1 Tax=Flammeovirga sp. SubArs3 TaxID=2995316 RepID=UPI00248ABB03|nr:hypothetical protein [Flammeovirga sp. SubArs3]